MNSSIAASRRRSGMTHVTRVLRHLTSRRAAAVVDDVRRERKAQSGTIGKASVVSGSRMVFGSLQISGVDDEWPGADETSSLVWPDIRYWGLRYGDPPTDPLHLELKWGGECRVEVELAAEVISDAGTVELRGWARLYEGDSEDTRDLEEQEPVSLTLLKNRQTSWTVHLESQGVGGGDRGTVEMHFTNVVEEEGED